MDVTAEEAAKLVRGSCVPSTGCIRSCNTRKTVACVCVVVATVSEIF